MICLMRFLKIITIGLCANFFYQDQKSKFHTVDHPWSQLFPYVRHVVSHPPHPNHKFPLLYRFRIRFIHLLYFHSSCDGRLLLKLSSISSASSSQPSSSDKSEYASLLHIFDPVTFIHIFSIFCSSLSFSSSYFSLTYPHLPLEFSILLIFCFLIHLVMLTHKIFPQTISA